MTSKDFILKNYNTTIKTGTVKWESPSNIALVKYWGKIKGQIPANPSISFTLSNCKTITEVTYTKKQGNEFSFDVIFEDTLNTAFKPKIQTFFERIVDYVPFIKNYHFTIKTVNTFPHSSGIASSASGMSALALCLMSIEKVLASNNEKNNTLYFNQKASFLARLGSGSACRSIQGPLIVWGKNKVFNNSSNLFGTVFQGDLHANFKNFCDTILLVDKGEKQVSSSIGHQLMHKHPFAEQRFLQAHQNIETLRDCLVSGDLKRFIEVVESEALTLHAMMMTSMPYFILMKPNTLKIISKIWAFRQTTNTNVCFTLDAGANVHLLYPEFETETILKLITNELVAYCQNGQYICDKVGFGAKPL